MYSWGDDTSDWDKPGAYKYSEGTKALRDEAGSLAKAHGPRAYSATAGPNEQLVSPKKQVTSLSPNPLVVAVDVTGSMQRWPAEIFDRLPLLYQTLSGYRPDLEILFAAIGDSRCDRWPLQTTSFSSSFSLEAQLKALHGEGGGGDIPESYGLFAYWMDKHVTVPNAERPFLIVFGDAPMHTTIVPSEIAHFLGDVQPQTADALATWRAVARTWNVWFLRRPGGTKGDDIDKQWGQAVGAQQVVHMDDEQRAVDWAMGLIARSWGHFDDFKQNMTARHDDAKVRSIEHRVAAIEGAIEAAKAPRVLDCPKCGAALPMSAAATTKCGFCGAAVHVPLRR